MCFSATPQKPVLVDCHKEAIYLSAPVFAPPCRAKKSSRKGVQNWGQKVDFAGVRTSQSCSIHLSFGYHNYSTLSRSSKLEYVRCWSNNGSTWPYKHSEFNLLRLLQRQDRNSRGRLPTFQIPLSVICDWRFWSWVCWCDSTIFDISGRDHLRWSKCTHAARTASHGWHRSSKNLAQLLADTLIG